MRDSKPQGATVLVVDDDPDTVELYRTYLKLHGLRPVVALDGPGVLNMAFAVLPDAILLDLALSGVDGTDVARQLKTDPRTRAVPIIAVTGRALPEEQASAKAAGCDAVLTKPCPPDDILQEIRQFLSARNGKSG